MGVLTLLRRRLRTHPLAFAAVVTAALMSMIVVATLQLLSGSIADAGVRSTLDVPAQQRSVAVFASVNPSAAAQADTRVRERLGALTKDQRISRVSYATINGIAGRAANARAQLADIDGLEDNSDLVSGRWPKALTATGTPATTKPGAPGSPGSAAAPLEVALPVEAAQALGLAPGGTLALTSLTSADTPDLTVTLTGTYRPKERAAALWTDDPLSLVGVRTTDYTTYGPFATAPGTFASGLVGKIPTIWRAEALLGTADVATVGRADESLGEGLALLRAEVGDTRESVGPTRAAPASPVVTGGRVESALPQLLAEASLVGQRIQASLLTPTVLLILLGAASLVMAARLLSSLRADETRLMRTRGVSTVQLSLLALVDSGVVVGVGAIGSLLIAPLLTGAIGQAAGVDLSEGSIGSAVTNLQLWVAVGTMAALAVTVVVLTSARSGRPADQGGGRGAAGLRMLSGSGVDLALVALGVLAVVQLRRYDVVGSTTVDPLTIAAPACVIAGLAVLCLRVLPAATQQVERLSVGHVGLDRAWGAWQLSRRLAAQGGTIVLILLCVAMGALALSHSATAGRALTDQSAFEAGAPVRVNAPVPRGLVEQAAGGADRVMPVLRESADLRTFTGVSVLGVDATRADRIISPRPDTLDGATWSALVQQLARARQDGVGVRLPPGTTTITATLAVKPDVAALAGAEASASLFVRDGRGQVVSLPMGAVTTLASPVSVTLPKGTSALAEPLTIVGLTATLPDYLTYIAADLSTTNLSVDNLRANGAALAGTAALTARSNDLTLSRAGAASPAKNVPAIMTRQLATGLDLSVGGTLLVPVAGRSLPVRVSAIVEAIPTAADPYRAILLDLPSLYATSDSGTANAGWSTRVPLPQEWWLDPVSSPRAVAALRQAQVKPDLVVERDQLLEQRRANPVNSGMAGAMLLVTAAAIILAAVGFAATTASLARTRHHENAILLALGMPPARIRRVLTIERVCVVVITVVVGTLMGVLAAIVVVPFLVGGDGHAQVPGVVVVIPWWRLVLLAAGIAAALSAIGVLVLRRTGSDLARELRMGEAR